MTLMAVYEILGKYGAPTYVLYQLPGFETIIREGTEEQIEAVMSTLGSGEQIWNSACTEPGAGSDVGALATTYKRENGKIYLNGTKTFITSSAGVKYLVIMAKNADDPTMFTEFFLDMSKPGVKLSPLTKLGLRMDSCCEVYMDNVELEEKDIFGKEGNGFMRGVSDFNFERWLPAQPDQDHRYVHQADEHEEHAVRGRLERRQQRRQLRPGRCRHVQVLLRQRLLRSDR